MPFLPDPAVADALDRQQRCALADSLSYLAEVLTAQLEADCAFIQPLLVRMQQGERFLPGCWGLYTELVQALQCGDNTRAVALLQQLPEVGSQPVAEHGFNLVSLGAPELADQADRYCRLMDAEEGTHFRMLPPSAVETAQFQSRLQDAQALLAAHLPALLTEMQILVSELVAVKGDLDADYRFDGGSTPMLWGALFLNVDSHQGAVALVDVLAHECAHLLLFAWAADEPLTLNPDDQRYSSPLRNDARPMEGIFHATWVSARMYYAMATLAAAQIDPEARQQARERMQCNRASFEDGLQVVEQYGQLTETGQRVMQMARDYMAQSA